MENYWVEKLLTNFIEYGSFARPGMGIKESVWVMMVELWRNGFGTMLDIAER